MFETIVRLKLNVDRFDITLWIFLITPFIFISILNCNDIKMTNTVILRKISVSVFLIHQLINWGLVTFLNKIRIELNHIYIYILVLFISNLIALLIVASKQFVIKIN